MILNDSVGNLDQCNLFHGLFRLKLKPTVFVRTSVTDIGSRFAVLWCGIN